MNRDRRFTIRLSGPEFQSIHDRAREHGVTVSDLMRAALLGPDAARALPSRETLASGVRHIARPAQLIAKVARRVQEAGLAGQLSEIEAKRTVDDLRRLHTPLAEGLNDVLAELNRLRPGR